MDFTKKLGVLILPQGIAISHFFFNAVAPCYGGAVQALLWGAAQAADGFLRADVIEWHQYIMAPVFFADKDAALL